MLMHYFTIKLLPKNTVILTVCQILQYVLLKCYSMYPEIAFTQFLANKCFDIEPTTSVEVVILWLT